MPNNIAIPSISPPKMDAIDSDDLDLEMAFMEEGIIPSFRQQRKPPVPRQVPLKLKTNWGGHFTPQFLSQKFKCNPHQFFITARGKFKLRN